MVKWEHQSRNNNSKIFSSLCNVGGQDKRSAIVSFWHVAVQCRHSLPWVPLRWIISGLVSILNYTCNEEHSWVLYPPNTCPTACSSSAQQLEILFCSASSKYRSSYPFQGLPLLLTWAGNNGQVYCCVIIALRSSSRLFHPFPCSPILSFVHPDPAHTCELRCIC